jgi:hypothetical protein
VPLLAPVPVGHASLSTAIVSTNGEDAMVLLMFLTGTVRVLFAALVGCFVHVVEICLPCADLGVRGRLFWQPNQATFFTSGCYKDAFNPDGTHPQHHRQTCPPRNPKNSRVNC